MQINWRVRAANPVFWANLAASLILPVLAYLGITWEDVTSWGTLFGIVQDAVSNPAILVSIAVSVWNAINDPTTSGLSDSEKALMYTKPH